ncbi:MAG: hypothetical protein ACR2O6_16040 [Ilumatobacteraceae bacterium]
MGDATADDELTSGQRWTEHAREIIENEPRGAFATLLTHDFALESHRGDHVAFDRTALLALYDSMKEVDMHITGVDVAVAGDHHVLTRRGYVSSFGTTELLAISGWTAGGRLSRLIEFEVDDLDAALAALETVAGAPVVRLG